jgi:ribonuclease Z
LKKWYTIKWPKISKNLINTEEKSPKGEKHMLDIVLPGTGGTTPRIDRHLSTAYLRHNGNGILVDCGEGTQIAVKKAGFSIGKIGLILLTHFHADHVSGLPGLLLTMGNEGRREKVKICGPKGVEEIVKALTIIAPELPFSIECVSLSDFDSFTWQGVDVTAFEVHHTGTCFGYDFRLRRGGKFDREKAEKNNVPVKLWRFLQNGQTVEENGVTFLVWGHWPFKKKLRIGRTAGSELQHMAEEGEYVDD